MGASASVKKDRAFVLVEIVSNTHNNSERDEALNELWNLSDVVENKADMTHPSLGLIPVLLDVLQSSYEDESKLLALRIFWYLSRDAGNCEMFGNKVTGVISVVLSVVIENKILKEVFHLFSYNIVMAKSCREYLLSTELGFFDYWNQLLCSEHDNPAPYRLFWNFSFHCEEKNAEFFVLHGVLEIFVNRILQSTGNFNPKEDIIGYYCLGFVMNLANTTNGANAMKRPEFVLFFNNFLPQESIVSVKAACILSNLTGKDEDKLDSRSLLHSHPKVLDLLVLLFRTTLSEEKCQEAKTLINMGCPFGTIKLLTIVRAFQNLSISDSNKEPLLRHSDVLHLIMGALSLFVDNRPELQSNQGYRIAHAGGGGEDTDTAEHCVEILSQLSFYFDADTALQETYLQSKYNMVDRLKRVCELSGNRQLSITAQKSAGLLLQRLLPKKSDTDINLSVSSSPASGKTAVPQHIMLSYAWAAKKQTVERVGHKLRELGFDVWRDEEGSSIVGPMSGDTDDTMADAIQASHTVVVFVSPQYKESANCRSEAKYSKMRHVMTGLKMIYVMLMENYHTKSSPNSVDGWLGFMIGTDLWYPLWNEDMLDAAVSNIAGLVGSGARLDRNREIVNCRDDGVTLNPIQQPQHEVTISSEVTSTVVAVPTVNIETAWGLINGNNPKFAIDETNLANYFNELGLSESADMLELDKEQVITLSKFLKPIPQKKFIKAFPEFNIIGCI